jgi:hypothetical protein
MALNNLIDLIAEVAARRVTREGKTKEATPSAVVSFFDAIVAGLRRFRVIVQKYST